MGAVRGVHFGAAGVRRSDFDQGRQFMADVVFVVLTLVVFAVLALCAKGAEKL
jgi:hypothetical protein